MVIDDLLQVTYWVRARLEPSPGRASLDLYSHLNLTTEHWFEGGVRHDLFLKFPGPESRSIQILKGDHVDIDAVVHCWSHQPPMHVGSSWITYVNNEGSAALGRILEVQDVWEERTGEPCPERGSYSKV